jgi:hypothetical protein
MFPIRTGKWRAAQAEAPTVALITGDKALLALANKYPVFGPAAFWERHGG